MKIERQGTDLIHEVERLRQKLAEANETIQAIRNGEIDAIIVEGINGHELYTLKSADRTYRTFIEQMSEGALTLNSEAVIVYCNSSFAKMVDVTAEQVISNPLNDYIVPEDHARLSALVQAGLHGDVKGEVTLKKNQHALPVQLSITALKMDEGTALSIIVTDLTAQKENIKTLRSYNEQLKSINLQLEMSNHDLQQFASVASHDLQEPLRKIQVFSYLLKDKYSHELSEDSGGYLDKIVHAANRMKMLIVDILNYSRLSSNDRNYGMTDISQMIRELLVDLELVIREKSAIVRVDRLPQLEINPGQMRQVFQNLISNALKFSKKDVPPVVEITSRQSITDDPKESGLKGSYCHISVKDNGIGFDERFSESIFNLFEKLHSKDDYDGTGIGLAITKKIIEKHHGQITVRSQQNIGTEFILSLPINQNTQ